MTDQPDLKARVEELEAQVRVAYGFDRDAVFANLDRQTARAQAAESRLALAEKVVEAAKKLAIEWISYDAGIYGDMKHQAAINDCGEALSAALAAYEGGGGASKLQGNQDDA